MTVAEMIAVLNGMPQDWEVVIPVQTTFESIGCTPSSPISSVVAGFDWDNGYVHLNSNDNIIRFSDEQMVEFNLMLNTARKTRRAAWDTLKARGLTYDEMLKEDTEKNVHALFRATKRKNDD